MPFGFHDGPHWIDVSGHIDIRLPTTIGSMLGSGHIGRMSSSNFGVYGSSILILPQRWKNSPMAAIHSMSTKITMRASSGRTMILLPAKDERVINHANIKWSRLTSSIKAWVGGELPQNRIICKRWNSILQSLLCLMDPFKFRLICSWSVLRELKAFRRKFDWEFPFTVRDDALTWERLKSYIHLKCAQILQWFAERLLLCLQSMINFTKENVRINENFRFPESGFFAFQTAAHFIIEAGKIPLDFSFYFTRIIVWMETKAATTLFIARRNVNCGWQ